MGFLDGMKKNQELEKLNREIQKEKKELQEKIKSRGKTIKRLKEEQSKLINEKSKLYDDVEVLKGEDVQRQYHYSEEYKVFLKIHRLANFCMDNKVFRSMSSDNYDDYEMLFDFCNAVITILKEFSERAGGIDNIEIKLGIKRTYEQVRLFHLLFMKDQTTPGEAIEILEKQMKAKQKTKENQSIIEARENKKKIDEEHSKRIMMNLEQEQAREQTKTKDNGFELGK